MKLIIPIILIASHFANADLVVQSNQAELFKARIQAAQFLNQATMGSSRGEVFNLADTILEKGRDWAFHDWLNNQFTRQTSSFAQHRYNIERNFEWSPTRGGYAQDFVWWDKIAYSSSDPLRERMTWAYSQIFVASGVAQICTCNNGAAYYWDDLHQNAFGTHLNLLKKITYSPLMGRYLSSLQNSKGDEAAGIFADENFAREVMQLFSIGVFSRNLNGNIILKNGVPVENYDNDDVRNLAKIMTGLNFRSSTGGVPSNFFSTPSRWDEPMVMDDRYHDQTEKTLLGKKFGAGVGGNAEIARALFILSRHNSTAPYMSMELIKKLTSSNPSSAYIKRVARVWRNTNGNLQSVIRAILMDKEARNAVSFSFRDLGNGQTLIQTKVNDHLHGRVKEPVLMLSEFFRFSGIETSDPFFHPHWHFIQTQQRPLYQTSVFNDYSSFHRPASGPVADIARRTGEDLVMPALEMTSKNYTAVYDMFDGMVRNDQVVQGGKTTSSPATLKYFSQARSVKASYERILRDMNLHLCGGMMPYGVQLDILNAMEKGRTYDEQFSETAALILGSAAFAVAN